MPRFVLFRLAYASVFSCPLPESEIDAIVTTAQRSNSAADITGVMLAEGGVFMQVLEGPPRAVAALFARIERDPRHDSVVLLRRGGASTRLFGERSMRLVEIGAEARAELEPVRQLVEAAAMGSAPALRRLDEIGRRVWSMGARGVATRLAG